MNKEIDKEKMDDKRAITYFLTLLVEIIIGIIFLLLFSSIFVNSFNNLSYGNYGGSQMDAAIVMLICFVIFMGMIVCGINNTYTKFKVTLEGKEVPYKCSVCDDIIMVKEIEKLEKNRIYCPIHTDVCMSEIETEDNKNNGK